MSQILSALMSFVMVFVQMVMSFLGGGGGGGTPITDPVTEDTEMRWPLAKSSYISEGYPNYSDGTYHGGIDIVLTSGNSEGEPFYAVQDGTVSLALNDGKDNLGYGNCLKIDHADGISSFYAHAKSIKVSKDDTVKKGQLIGYIGKTGDAETAHLHLEIWKETNGKSARVNPLDYITNPYNDTPAEPEEPVVTNGKFNFLVYGWGHGVGMSQDGAIALAKAKYDYKSILAKYYPGTTLKTDSSAPATVNKDGKSVSLLEFLCKTVAQEIGPSAPLEALKAQAVASYTYAKVYGYGNGQAYKDAFIYKGTNVEKACLEVLGMSKADDKPKATYVDYKGNAAQTFYFANAAGKTASSVSTWGGSEYAYLKGGVSSPETPTKSTKTYTAEEMRTLIQDYASKYGKDIKLGKDPSKWIEIVSHDSSMGSAAGYVKEIKVGGVTISGNAFRSYLLKYGLKSHCFIVEYNSVPKEVNFTPEAIEAPKPVSSQSVTPQSALPKSVMIKGVPFINQFDAGYPLGCEAVSATMLLKYFGYNVEIKDIVAKTPSVSKFYKKDGVWYGGDPFKGFVGNPKNTYDDGSYGCFAPPIVTAMKSFAGDHVHDISGCTKDQLFTIISKGYPVIVWCCNSDNKLSKDITWRIVDKNGKTTGDTFTMLKYEHCAVLVGYDEDYVYLQNPGRTANYKQDKALFLKNWAALYSQAILVA